MDKHIEELYYFLQKHSIIKQLVNNSYEFYDEPKNFDYELIMNNIIKDPTHRDGLIMTLNKLTASGVSFSSKKLALLKCLTEAVERICLFSFLEENIFIEQYNKLKLYALNPSLLHKNPQINSKPLGWMRGKELKSTSVNKDILLPAQLVYINYHWYRKGKEPLIAHHPISTGGAAGFVYEETVLRGIYEVLERDSIVNMYLAQIAVPSIDLSSIDSEKINNVIQKIHDYKLSLSIFYILNDFDIPTYVAVLIDNTNIGPKVTVGMKTNLDAESGILGSIEEVLITRPYIRRLMRESSMTDHHQGVTSTMNSIESRALFWAKPEAIHYLDFLFQHTKKISYKTLINLQSKKMLDIVIKKINNKGFKIYIADIKLPVLKSISDLTVIKVIIPHLQALYLDETKKIINIDRLTNFAKIFNKKVTTINPVPHPYL